MWREARGRAATRVPAELLCSHHHLARRARQSGGTCIAARVFWAAGVDGPDSTKDVEEPQGTNDAAVRRLTAVNGTTTDSDRF